MNQRDTERKKWKTIFEQEGLPVKELTEDSELREMFNFLLDYARKADPTIHLTDEEINRIAKMLHEKIETELGYLNMEREHNESCRCRECKNIDAISNKLGAIDFYFDHGGRQNKELGIEMLVSAQHRTTDNVLGQIFNLGFEYAIDIQKILDFMESPRVNKYFPIKVPSVTQRYKARQAALAAGIKL